MLPFPGLHAYSYGSRAFRLASFGDALIEHNIVSASDPHPANYVFSRNVEGFGNQLPSGVPLPLEEDLQTGGLYEPYQKQDSLETRVQDALLASML